MKPTIIDIKDWSPGGRDLVTLAVRSGRDADLPFVELLASDERVAFMSGPESGALVEALIQHGAASAHGGAARCTEPDCVLCTLTAQLEQERAEVEKLRGALRVATSTAAHKEERLEQEVARAGELEDRLQRVLSGGVHPAGCNAHACAPDCTVVERPAWLVELRTAVSGLERMVERARREERETLLSLAESLAADDEWHAAASLRDFIAKARAPALEAVAEVEPPAEPIAHCPKCGAPWFHTEGFCGGCRP